MALAAAALTLVAVVAVVALPVARGLLWRRELNPTLRGRVLAEESGCVTCHRPWSRREIPNAGSRWGTVPRLAVGNARMYASTRRELEEFIRYGAPRSWLDDPDVRARLEGQQLRMPAYDDSLTADEIEDLVAFVAAVERVELPGGETGAAGRELAWKAGCLVCHGVEGSGGLPNPRSMGGFVPGFLGANFTDLVRDEAEFREWVLDGTVSRLERNPLAAFFWRRQKISMPPYRGILSDEEVDLLWEWVVSIRG